MSTKPEDLPPDDYIEKYVNPVLGPLADQMARVMPSDPKDFLEKWFAANVKGETIPGDKKEASTDDRKEYVKKEVVPIIRNLTYECLCKRVENPASFLNEDKPWTKDAAADAADDDASEDDDDGAGEASQMQQVTRTRKGGVSAEKLSADEVKDWKPPKYDKSNEERQILKSTIRTSKDGKMHMLFGNVSDESMEQVVDAFFHKEMKDGEAVMEQGATGDNFYIVKEGSFEIYVQKDKTQPRKKVWEASTGFAFGELALMYNAPRSATIVSKGAGVCWALDRMSFRMLVVRAQEIKWKEYNDFLSNCEIFQTLSAVERASLAEILQEEDFEDGEAIIEQGERDDNMFIVQSGEAAACISGESGEVEVKRYKQGDYFGEIALLLGEPRKATVYALGDVKCVYIDKSSAKRVLGPMKDILGRNMDKYEKYADAIKQADAAGDAEEKAADTGVKEKGARKKRVKEVIPDCPSHAAKKETDDAAGGAGMTLKEKVAADFKRPVLVQPDPQFSVEGAKMYQFGGLKEGQKFTMNKPVVTRAGKDVKKREEDEGTVYEYSVPSNLKNGTNIALICQKGQKSADDPTPNQDNFFQISMESGIDIFGIADGHGPFGHIVSLRLVQSIPHYFTKSQFYPENMEKAMTEAFEKAQTDLVEFSKKEDVNFDASGSTGSIMVLEEQTLHLGFIGDSRLYLASWNRHDSRLIECTRDHKPNLPEEQARIESTGDPPGEVREVGEGSYRIYIKGENFPGLTMSRAFGDFACCERGVTQVPEYSKYQMQPGDEWYALVASDGIWEFLEGDAVEKLTSKKLRLKGPRETLRFLFEASRKRWAHYEGDYCDDVTAMLIMWNLQQKNSDITGNHVIWTISPPWEPPS